METNDKIKIAAFLVIAVLVIIIVWRILGKVGLVKSKEAKQKESAVEDFNTLRQFEQGYSKGKTFAPLGKVVSDIYAKELYNAHGVLNDNEDQVYSTFGKLKNKMNISEVSDSFYNLYKKDLRAYLGFLDPAEKTKLMGIINRLPNF
jgi:hypothetical protein